MATKPSTPPSPSKNEREETPIAVYAEFIALSLLFVVVISMRLWQIGSFPNGLHYDEAIDLAQGLRILEGDFFFFSNQGWGREPLFYYPLGLILGLIADNVTALRVAGVLCVAGTLAVTYAFVRTRESSLIAWFTVAWYGVMMWTLYIGRSGNRALALPLMMSLAVLYFWQGWEQQHLPKKHRTYVIAGLLLGGSVYTYQPSRFIPFVFIGFAIYVILFHWTRFKQEWQGWVYFFGAALVVLLPLIWTLVGNRSLEGDRVWTIEPLTQLLQGNMWPVWHNMVAVAQMFTLHGDALVSYNVPLRPVFAPGWTGIFFYMGLAIALWRWKRPLYAFMLIWLSVMLAPTILTINAPNFFRSIGAQIAAAFLAALGVGNLVAWLIKNWGGVAGRIGLICSLGVVSLGRI